MNALSHGDMVTLLVALAVLIGTARICGEIFTRLRQPAVIGEFLAGILLGPTVFGALAPEAYATLFPAEGAFPIALSALTGVAVVLFLLVAGIEVDLSTVWRQGKTAISVATFGMIVPFALGFAIAWIFPTITRAYTPENRLIFALFFATAMSISALPVIAKILMDLGIFRSDMGMVVVAAAIINDLAGWIIFAFLLSMMDAESAHMSVGATLMGVIVFTVLMLTLGRRALHWALPWVQAHTAWPGGVLGFSLALTFLAAGLTEWLGVHGIFGAFLFGVALGDSEHLRGRTRATLEQFISFIFAPLFFASVGLRIDFAASFDLGLVTLVLVIGTVGKVAGCWIGARLAGMAQREALAVGGALNARGAMEIILGLIAMEAGLIGERMFVALVVMALVTSMGSALSLRFLLGLKRDPRFYNFLPAKAFVASLDSRDRYGAICELAGVAAPAAGLAAGDVAAKAWTRELQMSTSLGLGVAVPHARLSGIKQPVVALGLSRDGIDFDAADGKACHAVFLLLIPADNPASELGVLADIARHFQRPGMLEHVLAAKSHVELLATLKTAEAVPAHG